MKKDLKKSKNKEKQSFFTKNAKKFFKNLEVTKTCLTFAPLSAMKMTRRFLKTVL
jgi:hypothetical protein